MKVYIKGDHVYFNDQKGSEFVMTAVELIEIIRILSLCITPEGDFHFNSLEFCV